LLQQLEQGITEKYLYKFKLGPTSLCNVFTQDEITETLFKCKGEVNIKTGRSKTIYSEILRTGLIRHIGDIMLSVQMLDAC
jgi:hypothetical protein